MPAAIGFAGAALAGGLAGFGAAGGAAASLGAAVLGTAIGATVSVGLYGLQLLMAGSGQTNTNSPSGVSFHDTGLRFDPTPNFTSSQAVIPLVFGKTSVNCQIAHKRLYGDNYKNGYFLLACGEAPLEIDQILIDDVPMDELSNYSASPDNDKSYYVWQDRGGKSTLILNGSGIMNWGASGSTASTFGYPPSWIPSDVFATITGPIVSIYGGGSLSCYFSFTQDKSDASTWTRFKIENYYSPSEVYYSTSPGNWVITNRSGLGSGGQVYGSDGWYYHYLDSTMPVASGHTETTTAVSGYYLFTGLDPNTTWKVSLEYCLPSLWADKCQVVFDKVVTADTETTEDFSCYGTAYALVHLAWQEPLSSTPQFSAVVKGFGREEEQDEGNPALCAYVLLTDREDPGDDPYDILLDRVEPEMVDWASVQETMQFCNDLKNGAGYRFNRAFGATMEKEAALKEMMAAGRFFIYCRGGIYTFRPDQDEPLTRIISESMEIVPGSVDLSIKSVDTPNLMRVSYYDEGLNYTVQTLPIELNAEASRYKPDSLDLTGVTDQTQAYEIGRYALLARSVLKYTCTINVRFATVLACFLGDIVEIDTDHPIISGLQWRLMAIPSELPGHIYTLSLVQHDADIYTSQLNGANEAGYVPYTPWYHIPIESGSPSSWPGGNLGPSQVINLDFTAINYYSAPSVMTNVAITYEYLASNSENLKVDYSTDGGQTWTNAGYPVANTFAFDVPLRWGLLMVRVAAMYQGLTGTYAVTQEYVEGLGGDDAGIGAAQIGWSPIGGDTL